MELKENYAKLWGDLKTEKEKYRALWSDIEKTTGITVRADFMQNPQGNKSQDLDEFVDDPTAAISVNQAGDYLVGILWGTGDKAVNIIPSRYVLEYTDAARVDDWYAFITDQTLYHMNHAQAGLHTALKPYAYDQFSHGTSGIGAFPNSGFKNRTEDNAIIFRNYGIDNTCIAEGKNGMIETVGTMYRWTVTQIMAEFCMDDGEMNQEQYAKMPAEITKAWEAANYLEEFSLVFITNPRKDFDPKLKGKRGTRYRGVWFMDQGNNQDIFYDEDFSEKPVFMARQIKVRGEAYGRSSGTLLNSTIKSVNFMVAKVIEIVEKMANPALGVWNSAIFGDSALDTSPDGLTVFNAALAGQQTPVFPVHDVGDPSAIIQFLIPYLNDKVTTAFKVDALLDFNSAKDMTATESLQRYAIRGKSLAGILIQQKVECLEPMTRRSVSILHNFGELGVDPIKDPERAKMLRTKNKAMRVIPEEVLKVMEDGRPWYELKFNNELEKLTRTEAVQNLLQVLNSIIAIAGMYPDIIQAVDWYKLLKEINDNMDYNNQILLSEDDFKNKIAAIAQQRQAAMNAQLAQAAGGIAKDASAANKMNTEAQNVVTK